jgi:hypothetical protein
LVIPSFVALIVTVCPVVPPLPVRVGVVSLVMLSVELAPVSDAETRSGAFDGVVGKETIDRGSVVEDAEVFPAGSVSVALTVQEPVDNVGRSHD